MSPTGDLLVTLIFVRGRGSLELAQRLPRVALALHNARRSTPFWVTRLQLSAAASQCFGEEKSCLQLRRAGASLCGHRHAPC